MDDLEKERQKLEEALEEAFKEPMIQLGTAVRESMDALPEVLKSDLEEALGVQPVQSQEQAPKIEPTIEPEPKNDF